MTTKRRATAKIPAARGLKLDRDGKLAVPEKSVEATIEAFLRTEGWQYIHTKAEAVKRSGAPAHAKYTLDAIALKPPQPKSLGRAFCFYLELKARNAKTSAKRLAGQAETARVLWDQGFMVYRAEEKDPDPIGSFKRWYGRFWA